MPGNALPGNALPDDEMTEVLADLIFRMHLDHNQEQPTKANETLMLLSWREHMTRSGVPWQAVPLLYNEAVKVKAQTPGRGFMPTIGELLHEWQNALEAGYWEKQNSPEPPPDLPPLPPGAAPLPGGINTDAAPEFARAFAQLATHGVAVTCHCPGDRWCHNGRRAARLIQDSWGSFWVCATGECDFTLNANTVTQLQPRPPEPEPVEPKPVEPRPLEPRPLEPEPVEPRPVEPRPLEPRPVESTEAEPVEARQCAGGELIDALQERCDFSPEKVGREVALGFARHLAGLAPAELWTIALARSQWEVWNEAGGH